MLIAWCVLQFSAVTAGFGDPVRHDGLRLRPVEVVAKPDLSGVILRNLRESPEARGHRDVALEKELATIREEMRLLAAMKDSEEKTRKSIALYLRQREITAKLLPGSGRPYMPVVPRTTPKVRD